MNIYLGVDPGIRITGYAFIQTDGKKHRVIDYGVIRPPIKDREELRYLVIFESLESLIEKHQPEYIAVETQFVHKNVKSALILSIARGMAMLAAARKGVPLYRYTPRKVKLSVGSGSADKLEMQRRVQLLLQLPTLPSEDEADALALALCCIQERGGRYV